MAETNHVVVHFTDGSLLKGTTQDFYPNRPGFHLLPADGSPVVEVLCRNMKALFFVKNLKGNAARPDEHGEFAGKGPNTQGKKIAVRFKDGELLCGYSLTYVPGREGFFMSPADANTNNLRVYVVNASAEEVKAGPEAEALAQKVLSEKSRTEKDRLATRR